MRLSAIIAATALTWAAFLSAPGFAQQQPAPPVAAAADLKFALADVATAFEKQTGQAVKLTFGSSGNFATQLEQGAPFQLYFSADEAYVHRLAAKGLTRDDGTVYAVGRIVLFAPHGSPLTVDAQMGDLKSGLADGRVRRFAIANPEHAPYGRRAMEALQRAGIWDAIRPKLVMGENIAQTAQFATTGGSQGGILALSLVKADEVARLGTYALIPENWHQPLIQRMVLMKNATAPAEAFYRYVQSPPAREIMRRYGFLLPGEQ